MKKAFFLLLSPSECGPWEAPGCAKRTSRTLRAPVLCPSLMFISRLLAPLPFSLSSTITLQNGPGGTIHILPAPSQAEA